MPYPNWARAPYILEDIYSFKDALVFAGLLNTLLNNCDSVKIACLAQLVNVIAPIFTEKGGAAIKQATYYPFELFSNYARGELLDILTECSQFGSKYGLVNDISCSVTHDNEKKEVCVFMVNYNAGAYDLEIELRSFGRFSCIENIL